MTLSSLSNTLEYKEKINAVYNGFKIDKLLPILRLEDNLNIEVNLYLITQEFTKNTRISPEHFLSTMRF
jgi:hypothetical protein